MKKAAPAKKTNMKTNMKKKQEQDQERLEGRKRLSLRLIDANQGAG